MPFEIRNIRQVEQCIRLIRVMGVTFLLIPLALAYTMLGMSSPSAIPILATVALILVETVLFSIIIYKS